jgi:phosphatidylglycerol:prolipoprotein diacylglycerol transferase
MGNIFYGQPYLALQALNLFNALENWGDFMKDPVGMLIGFSGLTFYGGLICGGAAVLYIAKNMVLHGGYVDIGGPGMMLAYALGRIGCQMAGDGDWGIVNTGAKTRLVKLGTRLDVVFKFPHNVNDEGCAIGELCG